jgi:hypothetical protein
MPIFEGPQGSLKSTACRVLGGQCATRVDNDVQRHLQQPEFAGVGDAARGAQHLARCRPEHAKAEPRKLLSGEIAIAAIDPRVKIGRENAGDGDTKLRAQPSQRGWHLGVHNDRVVR